MSLIASRHRPTRRRELLSMLGLGALTLACRPPRAAGPSRAAPRPDDGDERLIDQGRSRYNHVIITQQGSLRRMYFGTSDGRPRLQSTYDLERADSLHHVVFQTMVAALLVQPDIRRACMIGLGGGQLSNYLYRRYPALELDIVDICPEVIRLARAYFGVPDDPRYRIHEGDGRVFIESLAPRSADLLIHDAYRGDVVPTHLRTREFLTSCAERLAPGGVLIANLHRRSPRYESDRATMAAVFRHCYRFSSADDIQTAVVCSMGEVALTPAQLRANAARLQPRHDFDLDALASRCRIDETGWDADAVVRDDFARDEVKAAAEHYNNECLPGRSCAGWGAR